MNLHLSSEQICHWLAGRRGEEEQKHLHECAACQAELEQFQNALAEFRVSLEQCPVPAVSRAHIGQRLPRWVLATAALSLLVVAPVYWNARQQRAAEQAKADELLLERVQAGLSRSVPASMEPLMQLISREDK